MHGIELHGCDPTYIHKIIDHLAWDAIKYHGLDPASHLDPMRQDGLIAVWKASGTYRNDGTAKFSTFVYHAVRWAMRAYVSTLKRHHGREPISIDVLHEDDHPQYDAAKAEELLEALKQTPDGDLLLMYGLGFKDREIATITGKNVATVNLKRRDATEKFARVLDGDLVEAPKPRQAVKPKQGWNPKSRTVERNGETVTEPFRKLSPEQVRQIRGLKGVLKRAEIARRYRVTNATVSKIWNRQSYKWVTD